MPASSRRRRRNRERLNPAERFGEVISIVMLLLVFGFFYRHQTAATGFFTEKFGQQEMIMLYGPILFATIPHLFRMMTGRRNRARPIEAASNLFMAVAALRLLNVFPFDFSHLGDILPAGLDSVRVWFTDDVGRVLLTLQVIIGTISAILILIRFALVYARESAVTALAEG